MIAGCEQSQEVKKLKCFVLILSSFLVCAGIFHNWFDNDR